MRCINVAVICCLLVFSSEIMAQGPDRGLYKFVGRIVRIERDDSASSYGRRLKIEFDVKNLGKENLIFWNRDSVDTMGEGKIVRSDVSRSSKFVNQDIIGVNFWGPPNYYGKTWDDLRSCLDNTVPPAETTFTLKPGETWTFSSDVKVSFEKKLIDLSRSEHGDKLGEVWIRVYYASWSPNIEPKARGRATSLLFGRSLRERWKSFGYLLLDDLISDPIRLDLQT